MFRFLNRRKVERDACSKIGVVLHKQIIQSVEQDEAKTGIQLQSFFTTGYIYSFVNISFTILGLDGKQATNKHLKYICNGVYPKKLYEIYSRYSAALDMAWSINNKDKMFPGYGITPSDAIKQFEMGIEVGAFDAGCFNTSTTISACNLRRYLLGEKLEYLPLPD